MAYLIQTLLFIAVVWVARWLWLLVSGRRILDNIPGPHSPSFVTGNMREVFSPTAWDYHTQLVEKCVSPFILASSVAPELIFDPDEGGVVRIDGLFGVRRLRFGILFLLNQA
jgi:hypothetical protein